MARSRHRLSAAPSLNGQLRITGASLTKVAASRTLLLRGAFVPQRKSPDRGERLFSCCVAQILKTLVVALLVAGVIPLLLGLLFELVIVAPLRVPLDQTPLFYPWQVRGWCRVSSCLSRSKGGASSFLICLLQDWALGVLHAKIIAAITLMGPQWWLKTVIEQVCYKCVIKRTKEICFFSSVLHECFLLFQIVCFFYSCRLFHTLESFALCTC